MARLFTVRPPLTLRGRKFKGLRGYAGKPFHPPLTDIPVACYFLVGIFDLISYIRKDAAPDVSHDFFVSATHVLVVGAIVAVPTAITGIWDWWKSTESHTQAWRTANTHMAIMLTVTAVVVVDIFVRLSAWDEGYTELLPLILSLFIALFVSIGAAFGGSLVYDYGFNVETSGDHPVWHESEVDVFPGQEKATG